MLNPARRWLPIAAALLAAALGPAAPPAAAADCNHNGTDDFAEVAGGQESDCDGNGIPDSCDVLRVNHGLAFHERLRSRMADGRAAAASAFLAEDLDRDGHVDLAVLVSADLAVSVLWGDGQGGFSDPARFDVGFSTAVALGDVDGDGHPDLACGSSQGVILLTQQARRSFSEEHPSLLSPSNSGALAPADLDGDGDLDIALAGPFEVFIFPGAGDGSFAEPEEVPAGSGPIRIALADVDGDGDPDIVTANSLADQLSGSISVFLNSGGAFAAPRNYAVGTAPSSLAAGDLDHDGRADLVVTNSGSADISVFLGREDGRLSPLPRLPTGGSPLSVSLADIDLDGDADIAVSRAWDASDPLAGGAVTLFWSHTSAVIRRGFDLRTGGKPVGIAALDIFGGEALEVAMVDAESGDIHVLVDAPVAYHPDCNGNLVPDACDVLTEDCNANGFNDVCDVREGRSRDCNGNDLPDECESDCNRNLFPDDCDVSSGRSADCNRNEVPDECDLRHGSLSFEVSSMGAALRSMIARDLDRDGLPDLAGFDLSEELVVSWNGGSGALEPSAAVASGAAGSSFAAGDVDGDGDIDLVEGNRDAKKVRVLLQSERRVFSPGPEVVLDRPPGSVTAEDLDGDGLAEIAALDASGDIIILGGAGGGALRPIGTVAAGAAPGFFTAADIDGDRARDLVCILPGGAPAILWNRGGASFTEPTTLSATLSVQAPAIGDIDRDGDLDFALMEEDDAILFVQTGPRVFERTGLFRSSDVVALVVADADLDGASDLVVAHRGKALTGLEVRRGEGDGAFGEPHVISTPVGLEEIAVTDLDRSGSPDLVAEFQDTPCPQCPPVGRIFVWRNRTLPPASLDVDRNGRPDECDPGAFRRGDPDGDGSMNLADAVFTLRSLFQGGPAPGCAEAADADNDGTVGLSDAVLVLEFLFRGGPPPTAPGPPPGPCGLDPDAPGSAGDLGCASYESC